MDNKTIEILQALRDCNDIARFTADEISDALNDALTRGFALDKIYHICHDKECVDCKLFSGYVCKLSNSPFTWDIEEIIKDISE